MIRLIRCLKPFTAGVAGGSAVCAIIAAYISSHVAAGFGRNLRSLVFRRVESYSLHEFDR